MLYHNLFFPLCVQQWLERLGHVVPVWDFRVPGVSSISMDLHKYAYTLKGTPDLDSNCFLDLYFFLFLLETTQHKDSWIPVGVAAWAESPVPNTDN